MFVEIARVRRKAQHARDTGAGVRIAFGLWRFVDVGKVDIGHSRPARVDSDTQQPALVGGVDFIAQVDEGFFLQLAVGKDTYAAFFFGDKDATVRRNGE